MPKRNILFFDPKYNEWLYNVLINLTQQQKALLNTHELRLLKSNGSTKQFVNLANLEKKLIILTKVGVECNLLFYKPEKFDSNMIKKVYRQYTMKGKPIEMIDEMIESEVFVINSKDIATSLAMMSMNCHSQLYIPNMRFLKVRKHTTEAQANVSRGISVRNLVKEFGQGMGGLSTVAKLANQVVLLEPYLTSIQNLRLQDYLILNYLFEHQNKYVNVDVIKRAFSETYKMISTGQRCVYLWKERGLIDKMPSSEDKSKYRITQDGVLLVGEICNKIVSSISDDYE